MNQASSEAAIAASAAQAISTVPPTSPSSPSMKFIALVQPRTQKRVSAGPAQPRSTTPVQGKPSRVSTRPLPSATSAAASCATNRSRAERSRTSSTSATTAIATAAQITPRNCRSAMRAKSVTW